MTDVQTAPAIRTWDVGAAGVLQQLYSTTLLDLEGAQAFEWAYVPAGLLEWDEPNLERTLEALELEFVEELRSLSALPMAIVAMLESAGGSDPTGALRGRLDELLDAKMRNWSDAADLGTLTFAQFAAFSAVLPVERSPLHKVPVADAAFKLLPAAAAAGLAAGAHAGSQLAVAAGVHGAAVILVGAGGVVVGALAAPIGVVAAAAIAMRLLGHRLPLRDQ